LVIGGLAKFLVQLIGLLDGVIKPALKDNAQMLADWQASKQVRQAPVTPLPTGSVALPSTPSDSTLPQYSMSLIP
jgi:hypothetical protein